MARLYRVQDSEGRGPYRPGLSHLWSDDSGPIVKPWWVEMGISLDAGMRLIPDNMFSGSAFRTMDQLCNWFTPLELEKLDALGFVLCRFRPDKIVYDTPTQILFAQRYPLAGLPIAGRLVEREAV